jgi:hypothetical protein
VQEGWPCTISAFKAVQSEGFERPGPKKKLLKPMEVLSVVQDMLYMKFSTECRFSTLTKQISVCTSKPRPFTLLCMYLKSGKIMLVIPNV